MIESLSHVSGDPQNNHRDDFPENRREDEHQQKKGAQLELRPTSGDDDDDNTARLAANDVDSEPRWSVSRIGHVEEVK